jgi:hypothetical protein
VSEIVAALRSDEAEKVTRLVIDRGVTRYATPEMKEWLIQCNLKMPRDLAGTLAYNHWHMDWRDLIPRIKLPTLIITVELVGRHRGNHSSGFIIKSKVHSSKYSKKPRVASILCLSKILKSLTVRS